MIYNDTIRRKTLEEDLVVPLSCEDVDPFTPRIRNFRSSRKTRMPNNVKTYDGIGDPEDHLKVFQASAQVERWAMPTWCHMFNSTLIGAARVWFDELPPESIDSYKDLKAAFLAYFMQQKKHVKDTVEIHNIKQRDEETIDNPELTKRLNERVPKTLEEMMTTTTTFIRGETVAATPKEIFAVELEKFKPPPPMVTPADKRSSNKLCEFHNNKGHSTDECMQLKKQIEELKVTLSFAHVNEITFPPLSANKGTKGPLVIEAEIRGHAIHRMYVDRGSSMEVPYEHCFNRLRPEIKSQMVPATTSLTGFIRSPSPYNDVIRRPGIREIQAVPSTAHGMLKFLVNGGVVTIRSTILTPNECTTITTTSKDSIKKIEGGQKNLKPSDMTGVPRQIAEHRLNIWDGYPPIRQKKRGQASERAKAIQAEVQKLVKAGIMREVYYHDWLSNPVMEIDWKVESLCGYPFKCFLDAYKGYHQIQMAELDEEKMAFHTPHGVYCYTKMPFGLKNAGATYQRLVDKAFEKQVGRNLEVYVDNLVIKSHTEAELLRDIEETFCTLRNINMKLNLKKCTFRAVEGMFLGYMVGPEGIKPCPEKIEAVLQLLSPRTIKEVQSLNGRLAGLNRFLSKSAEKSLPLFKTLKKCIKKSDFYWTPEAKQAFKQLKQHISKLPMLVATRPKEELIMYLSASQGAVGAILMTERDSIQTPVYFVSRALQGPELNYTPNGKTSPSTGLCGQEATKRKPQRMSEKEAPQEPWTLFKDGSSCIDRSGEGLILTSPDGAEFTYALRFQFTASNNEAEYEALLAGLRIATQMGVCSVQVSVDSKLVANQVLGTYIAKEENMIKYLEKVLVEVLQEKSIQEKKVAVMVEEEGPTWMTPITEYLKDGVLPDDKKEANKLRIKARQYELMDEILYRRSFLRPWLRDARDMILKCKDCQVHRPVPRNPQQPLTPITSPWPFYKWGIDIAGPFLEGPGKVKFLIVAMDYFTKWIEAKAVATISGGQVKKFVWDNIRFASVKHPQSNGLVERANRSLGERIKARLGEGNKNWIEEIPHVLWAHRIMIKSSNGDTPFSLTYGTEAIIPAKIGVPTYRTAVVDVVHNDDEIRLNLDLLEERRERAAIREAKAKSKMMRYYNARVRGVTFKPGDYVYHSNEASNDMDEGKLGPKWEGPYEVTEVLGGRAYKLRSMDGAVLSRTWNIANLKKCYL
ncbi:reverse transcriptase domain-containing protein [Tanacetum coccineum]